jgi:hypothetical protein
LISGKIQTCERTLPCSARAAGREAAGAWLVLRTRFANAWANVATSKMPDPKTEFISDLVFIGLSFMLVRRLAPMRIETRDGGKSRWV